MFKRKPKRVYVLGAGPAGLLAAHAATTKGYEPTIYSRPHAEGGVAKSVLYGCQYLHATIPGITYSVDGRPVRYQLEGPVDGYRRKVYGDSWSGSVSPDEYGPEDDHYAWDIRAAYDKLWGMYGKTATPMDLRAQHIAELFADKDTMILNTIPTPVLCRDMDNHKFASRQIWAMGSKPVDMAQPRLPYMPPDMTVMCSGWRDTGWYRAATVFGYSTLEWPGGRKPPIAGVVPVSKPLSTDCSCWQSSRSVRLGRFGQWRKGVLVHTAYFEAMEALP